MMRNRHRFGTCVLSARVLGLGCAIVVTAGQANAQAWNIPLGGRTATMAASVAEGHGVAHPIINPAGVAAVSNQVFGLSGSIYGWSRQDVSGFNAPDGFAPEWGRTVVDTDEYDSSNILTVPSAVAYFQHMDLGDASSNIRGVVAMSATVPVYVNRSSTGLLDVSLPSVNGSVDRNIAVTENTMDLYVGPTVALSLHDRLRLGVSAQAVYHKRFLQVGSRSEVSSMAGNGFAMTDSHFHVDIESKGVVGVLGAQAEAFEGFWVGLSVMTPSRQLGGSESRGTNEVGYITTPTATLLLAQERTVDVDLKVQSPARLSLGAAYVQPASFALAADVTFRPNQDSSYRSSGAANITTTQSGTATRTYEEAFDVRHDGLRTTEFAIGGEVWVSEGLALRAGYDQTMDGRQFGSPSVATLYQPRRDYRTLRAGVGLQVGTVDSTFGLAYQMESGTVDVRDYYSVAPDPTNYAGPRVVRRDLEGQTVMLLLAGVISEQEARDSVRRHVNDKGLGLPPMPR